MEARKATEQWELTTQAVFNPRLQIRKALQTCNIS
ncbi:MAG: hypothetical protein ACI9DO_000784 [Reinekea sp.]|jgi:hypothetical protein